MNQSSLTAFVGSIVYSDDDASMDMLVVLAAIRVAKHIFGSCSVDLAAVDALERNCLRRRDLEGVAESGRRTLTLEASSETLCVDSCCNQKSGRLPS